MKNLLIFSVIFLSQKYVGAVSSEFSDKTSITISCDAEAPSFNPSAIEELTYNCVKPNISYAEIFKKYQLTKLKTLHLNLKPSASNLTLNSKLFENLNVTDLTIDYKYFNKSGKVDLIRLNSDVLYVLNYVQKLVIRGVAVVDNKDAKTENGELQCASLQILMISASDLKLLPSGWLKPCKRLHHLKLSELRQRNATKVIRRKILDGARSLRKLEILNCYVEELEDELSGLDNLEILNVAHNQIHYALTTIVLPNLVVLDLSYNHIFSSALLSSGVEKQPRLRILSVDYNPVLNICDRLDYRTTNYEQDDGVAVWHSPLDGRSLNMNSIERFSLKGTIATNVCFGHLIMSSLVYFDLSDSKISAIDFHSLPVSRARRLEVNVTGCPIGSDGIWFTEQDYQELHHEELRITGLNVTLECDCDEYLWLAKAARERKVILSGAKCSSGQDLSVVPSESLQCSKEPCGVCTCRRYWQGNVTDVDCSGQELRSIPQVPGLRSLLASNNLVENITVADIPDSLIYLDLRSNHIARMSEAASIQLFKNPNRSMRFYANPIVCDCDNKPFILGLMDHFEKVLDYTSLTCIDGRFISKVNPLELCFISSRLLNTVLVSSLGALIGIAALTVGLYYRFGRAAKVYLYSKGLCLFCIRESEIDADREYDAFVSFSHKDEEFVTNELIANLEKDPYRYKICVHYRNWIAGELIPAQISQSIRNSKRTIVVLSKSFLDSLWGLLEFRAAHLSSLKEGRTRLIIIIVDDILETGNLDGELRTYLRTNTYVKWGDPWFWDKVRYALPHRKSDAVKIGKDSDQNSRKSDHNEMSSQKDGMETENSTVEVKDNARATDEDRIKGLNINQRHRETNRENINKDANIEDTKENPNEFNETAPIIQQLSNDSAIEMDNLGYSSN